VLAKSQRQLAKDGNAHLERNITTDHIKLCSLAPSGEVYNANIIKVSARKLAKPQPVAAEATATLIRSDQGIKSAIYKAHFLIRRQSDAS
jgi:hypothetical protein